MRWPLLSISLALTISASRGSSQDPIRWVQSTNYADSQHLNQICKKLNEPSPIKGLDKAVSLERLMSMYPITIWLDEKALDDENVSPEEPIKLPNVPGISIRNQLQLVLEPMQLTYIEKPGYLMITSKKSSANVVRLYDVTSFVQASNVRGKYNFEPLIGLIERSIHDDQWECAGGNLNMTKWSTQTDGILVVNAPQETHEAIRDLFNAQRDLLKRSSQTQTPRRLSGTGYRASSVRRSSLGHNAADRMSAAGW